MKLVKLTIWISICFVSICLFMAPLPVVAEHPQGDIIVEAEGLGISKKDALLKAKREAVETGIGTVLISQTEIENFQLQKDIILTRTLGAVKRYDIVHQERQQDGTHFVQILATVSLSSIKADLAALKILMESMDKPRMMVVIKETEGKNAENAIVDYLKSKEFDLVDPAIVAAIMRKDSQLIESAARGNPAAAAKIGASNGAEYIIVGTVTKSLGSHSLLSDAGMVSGQATITAKVVNCSNASIIASKSARSAAAHISEDVAKSLAASKSGTKLMDNELFEAIVSSFQDMINNGMPLDVKIQGIASFQMQKSVRQKIQNIPDVVSVTKRRFGDGQLFLSVLFKGNADAFSDAIDGLSLAEKSLHVTSIEGSRVTLKVK